MSEVFGERRKQLMRHLLRHKTGCSIDELALAIGVTRTAVRQHLAALSQEGLVAPGGQRARLGAWQTYRAKEGRREFPERDKDGGTRGMRLMLCDVEVAHAEREVDRIDVFERRGEEREVGREKDQRKRGQPAAHGVRPAEA